MYPSGNPSSTINSLNDGNFRPADVVAGLFDNRSVLDVATFANTLGIQISLIQNFVNATRVGLESIPVATGYIRDLKGYSALFGDNSFTYGGDETHYTYICNYKYEVSEYTYFQGFKHKNETSLYAGNLTFNSLGGHNGPYPLYPWEWARSLVINGYGNYIEFVEYTDPTISPVFVSGNVASKSSIAYLDNVLTISGTNSSLVLDFSNITLADCSILDNTITAFNFKCGGDYVDHTSDTFAGSKLEPLSLQLRYATHSNFTTYARYKYYQNYTCAGYYELTIKADNESGENTPWSNQLIFKIQNSVGLNSALNTRMSWTASTCVTNIDYTAETGSTANILKLYSTTDTIEFDFPNFSITGGILSIPHDSPYYVTNLTSTNISMEFFLPPGSHGTANKITLDSFGLTGVASISLNAPIVLIDATNFSVYNLPTTNPGGSGQVYKDSNGFLKIS